MQDSRDRLLNIGVLIGNSSSDHTMNFMHGVYEASEKEEARVLFFLGMHTSDYYRAVFGNVDKSHNYDYQCNVIYDYANFANVDALIISYGTLCIFLENNNKEEFLKRFGNIPYVLVTDQDETGRGSSMICDNYHGMYDMTEHLVSEHHCRRFTMLAGPAGNTDAAERRRGVEDCLRAHGIPFDESHVEYGDFSVNVKAQAEALLDRYPDADAMLCANDTMAVAAYQVCESRGRIIGRDIAVTGFDDSPDVSPLLSPMLTTVRQDAERMGYQALREAIALARGKKPENIVIPVSLSIRSSCGCRSAAPSGYTKYELKQLHDRFLEFKKETWFMPQISRNMIDHIDDDAMFYTFALDMLPALGCRSGYLLLQQEPGRHLYGEQWSFPKKLFLRARFDPSGLHTYTGDDSIPVSSGDDMRRLGSSMNSRSLCIIPLYAGEMQYGLLAAEVDTNQLAQVYLASQQISVALEFQVMAKRQADLNRELKVKNEILGFLSEVDQMTDCLNRRGFMEKAVQLIRENEGCRMQILFADIDHLKQINDTFGHSEGDYAIITSANIIRSNTGPKDLVGRIGGDEFVILRTMPEGQSESTESLIKAACDREDALSRKPYYVNLSIGRYEFTADADADLGAMIQQADTYLYEAKKLRRASVCRVQSEQTRRAE